ncbi:MAG: bifunctional riboflavin kinase/FAD synthetase [Catonella sp.]|uniref:bifunctional riboflavin kinase/FAD synthetase n=1 Tax=Catonella sp. TaxID=2382125 RepID=UPI003F9F613B
MEYIQGSDFKLYDTVVTLGKFDGLHLGHKELIDEVLKTGGLTKVLFTFEVNPFGILFEQDMKVIDTNEERKLLAKKFGLDYMINFPFTKDVIDTDANDFIEKIIHNKLGAKKLVVGTDFRFGKGRLGDVTLLERRKADLGYELKVVEKKVMYGEEISSTRIRNLIGRGDIKIANELLGRAFSYSGEIIHGNHIGHTIGMPTINIKPEEYKLLPPYGVYTSDTELDGKIYRGITNIGVKPTISKNNAVGIETWLFGLNEDVYGHFAKVKILDFIRPEMKFDSLDALKKQVDLDKNKAMTFK